MATNFIKSPTEVEDHQDVDKKKETKDKFKGVCEQHDDIISKGSGNIGKTLLIEMDSDTGDSPPITSTGIKAL